MGVVGLTASAVAGVFAILRAAVAGHGRIASFALVGSRSVTDRRALPHGVPVVDGPGYDGQFYYRLALDPADLSRTAFGIRLDDMERLGRIAYPALAWLAAGGVRSLVPVSLVVVNVVLVGCAAGSAAALVARSGRSPWWGLAPAGYVGFLWTLGRDLTELTAAAALLGGLLALRARRPWLAGALLAVAALGREVELVAAAAVAVVDVTSRVVRRWPPPRRVRATLAHWRVPSAPIGAAAWAVPVVVFVLWQVVVIAVTGASPLAHSGSANLAVPFDGLVHGVAHYLARLPSVPAAIWVVELALLVVVTATAAVGLRTATVPPHEVLLWVLALVVVVSAAPGIWLGDVGFRSFDDLFVMSWVVILGQPAGRWRSWSWWPRLVATAAAAVWLGGFVELVRFI